MRSPRWLTTLLILAACDKPAEPVATPAAPAATAQPDPAADPAAEPAAEGLPDRDPALARRLVRDEGALLLDVRTSDEFDEGHVEGATLVPHDEVAARIAEIEKLQGGDKSKPIVVYCKSGGRAGEAKKSLQEAGFTNVTNLGGVGDWCEDC